MNELNLSGVMSSVGESAKEAAEAIIRNEIDRLVNECAMQPEIAPDNLDELIAWLEGAIHAEYEETEDGLSLSVSIDDAEEGVDQSVEASIEDFQSTVIESLRERISERLIEAAIDAKNGDIENELAEYVQDKMSETLSGAKLVI